jgi:hypothetical protein
MMGSRQGFVKKCYQRIRYNKTWFYAIRMLNGWRLNIDLRLELRIALIRMG